MTIGLAAYDRISDSEPGLWTQDGRHAVPLKGVTIRAEIACPAALTRMTQHFRNDGKKPIEARYVFPTPLDAILTGMEIRVGERILKGVVKAKSQAERDYEDAIVKGDSGFLLTRLDDGLYQISVGNVLPGEDVYLEVQWAELLRWNGRELRYRLPNLVGPHYGDPLRAGIAPADAPTTRGDVRYTFDAEVMIRGELAAASIASPSHLLRTRHDSEGTHVTLQAGDMLDRSLTLLMSMASPPALVAWRAPEGQGSAVLASLFLASDDALAQPRQLTVLVDCSGSMIGISIDQAREATCRIIDALAPEDSLSLVLFGSHSKVLTRQPLVVGRERAKLQALCTSIEADLGGTELQEALAATLKVCPEGGDILLITDGQVYFSDSDIRNFARQGRRLFTIGVGHSTSEKVLRRLSEASGGFCELVSPNEDMAGHIVSHFRRMTAARVQVEAQWPGQATARRAPGTVFAGDTALFTAQLSSNGEGELRLQVQSGERRTTLSAQPAVASGELLALLPRLVAWSLLPTDHVQQAAAMAEKYQLVTEHTSMIAVLERDMNGDIELPEVVDVPQMEVLALPMMCKSMFVADASYDTPRYLRNARNSHKQDPSHANLHQVPAFLRRADEYDAPLAWLQAIAPALEATNDISGLDSADLPAHVSTRLLEIAGLAPEGDAAWQRWLLALALEIIDRLPAPVLRELRALRKALAAAQKVHAVDAERDLLRPHLDILSADHWGI